MLPQTTGPPAAVTPDPCASHRKNRSPMSKSHLFPTMGIGSLPRPRWIIDLVNLRQEGRITEEQMNRAIDPAIQFAIATQEQAGMDYVSDGEWRRFTYFTGFMDAVEGFAKDVFQVNRLTGGTKMWPGIVSKLKKKRSIASGEARFIKAHTGRKVKMTLPSP